MVFEVKYRDVAGRVGILKVNNKSLETPFIFPVINPNKQFINIEDMKKYLGVKAIMINAYILLTSKYREDVLNRGIHKFLGFDGLIETDSGSYQMLHYKKSLEFSNKEIINFQLNIGSDIINVLDIPTDIDASYDEAKRDLDITLSRIKEGLELVKNKNILINGAIQGGIYNDLRRISATEVSKLSVDIFAIGTIVPYMVNYQYKELFELIMESMINLPKNRPIHLFGMGHPLILPLSVALGADIFDSASYILFAEDNRVMYSDGTKRLEDLEDSFICGFKECLIAKEVRKLEKYEKIKIIGEHNLKILVGEINAIKDSIKYGYLWDLVLIKAHMHKKLYEATRYILGKYYEYLKKLDPIRKKKGIRYYGDLLELRSDIKRALDRLKKRNIREDKSYLSEYVYPFNQMSNE